MAWRTSFSSSCTVIGGNWNHQTRCVGNVCGSQCYLKSFPSFTNCLTTISLLLWEHNFFFFLYEKEKACLCDGYESSSTSTTSPSPDWLYGSRPRVIGRPHWPAPKTGRLPLRSFFLAIAHEPLVFLLAEIRVRHTYFREISFLYYIFIYIKIYIVFSKF
jgi:hypothetical protein